MLVINLLVNASIATAAPPTLDPLPFTLPSKNFAAPLNLAPLHYLLLANLLVVNLVVVA